MSAAVLFTGGKDSVFALHKVASAGLRPSVLVSVIPLYKYSMLYHQPYFPLLSAQAYSLNIPLETIGVGDPRDEERALESALRRARDLYGVKYVVSGAIASNFQKKRFEAIARKLGLEPVAPLWGVDQRAYLRSVLESGIEFVIISITSMGIPHDLLGRPLGPGDIERIVALSAKYGFNPSFEGGEAETLVVDAPLFKYRISLSGEIKRVSDYEAYFVPRRFSLAPKKAQILVR